MAAEIVGLINPIFVEQHLVVSPAAEAAIQDVVASLHGLARSLADDERAGAQMLAQNTKASDFRLRCELPNDAGDCGAMAIHVAAIAGHSGDLLTLFDNGYVIGQGQPLQKRMLTFDARIEHGNFDVCPFAAAQERAGLLECRRGICRHSLQPIVQLNNLSSTSCDRIAVVRCTCARCSGPKPFELLDSSLVVEFGLFNFTHETTPRQARRK